MPNQAFVDAVLDLTLEGDDYLTALLDPNVLALVEAVARGDAEGPQDATPDGG